MNTRKATEPTSLEDAAYKFSVSKETMLTLAQYILTQCPDILDDIPKEIRAKLYAGFQIRKHELTGDKFYRIGDGGVYIPLDKPGKDDKGIVSFSINTAMSYTQQEFGKLKSTEPGKHAILGELRKAFSTYASNNINTLKSLIRDISKGGKPRERSANKDFRDAMTAVFEAYDKRVRTAKDRGDTDADPVRYRVARDAFWKAYDSK